MRSDIYCGNLLWQSSLTLPCSKKPFFYVQHPHPKDTVYTTAFFCHDDGCATKVLSKYPNAVALSGHSHTTLTDERSVWRGAFTSVGCSTLTARGCEHPFLTEPFVSCKSTQFPPRQGMVFSVYDDRIVIDRRDFTYGLPVDEPWVIWLGDAEDWSFAARKARSPRPEFPPEAVLEIVNDHVGRDATLRFPQAFANPKARAFAYAVTIEQLHGADEEVYRTTFQVNSPTALVPQSAVTRIPIVQFTVPAKHLPTYDMGRYRVTVVAKNSFGAEGRPLTTGYLRVPKS